MRGTRIEHKGALALGVTGALAGALLGCGSSSEAETQEQAALEQVAAVDSPAGRVVSTEPLLEPLNGEVFGQGLRGDSEEVLSAEQSCAASSVEAERIQRTVETTVVTEVSVPSVFYLMLDRSGSMVEDEFTLVGVVQNILALLGVGSGPISKWDYAVDELTSFFRDENSSGMSIALQYFPDGGQCDGGGYDQPEVPLNPLPGNSVALVASLGEQFPQGGTPLEGALRGATEFCSTFNLNNPDQGCVAVLITDGAASDCSARDAQALATIAGNAREQGVVTFAAGMQGANFSVLDAIAQAGGGDCSLNGEGFACDLTSEPDAFVGALERIRERLRTQTRLETRTESVLQTLPCQWDIPASPPGKSFDRERVNVELSSNGAKPQSLPAVSEAANCTPNGGWYYDDPQAPSSIEVCPSTCAEIEPDAMARVDILFGCKTVLR